MPLNFTLVDTYTRKYIEEYPMIQRLPPRIYALARANQGLVPPTGDGQKKQRIVKVKGVHRPAAL